jgi:hypothetical protein
MGGRRKERKEKEREEKDREEKKREGQRRVEKEHRPPYCICAYLFKVF